MLKIQNRVSTRKLKREKSKHNTIHMDTYNTGAGAQQVSLAVDIDTIGLAASRAIVVDVIAGTGVSVAHSVDATGDIALVVIGSAGSLQGKRLTIFTRIDLLGPDINERKKEFNRLSGSYSLSGGLGGNQNYKSVDKSAIDSSYVTIILNESIDLI